MSDTYKTGDIIFIRIDNLLYRRISSATGSWTSHVGIIVEEDGKLLVAESTIPRSKKNVLADFLHRSAGGMFAVKRMHGGLMPAEIARLRTAIAQRMGILYHTGFNYDSSRQFCSKFVYDVYRAALGVEIGRLETLRDLFQANEVQQRWFWRLWYFGYIPWQRRTITPASQYCCPILTTVQEQL